MTGENDDGRPRDEVPPDDHPTTNGSGEMTPLSARQDPQPHAPQAFSYRRRHVIQGMILSVLFLIAAGLLLTIASLERQLQERRAIKRQLATAGSSSEDDGPDSQRFTTTLPSEADRFWNLTKPAQSSLEGSLSSSNAKSRHRPQAPTHGPNRRNLYWDRAVAYILADWDPTVLQGLSALESTTMPRHELATSLPLAAGNNATTTTAASLGLESLIQAANLGHPNAQLILANAYSTGLWPVQYKSNSHPPHLKDSPDDPPSSSFEIPHLHVQESFQDDESLVPTSNIGKMSSSSSTSASAVTSTMKARLRQQRHQQHKAWILWHMAAMGGNLEAAMILAYRMTYVREQHTARLSTNTGSSTNNDDTTITEPQMCRAQLEYYQAAADGILDWLQASPQSRAKVLPAGDKHTLHMIELFGGTSSKLDMENQPNESPQALQFYHVRATDNSAVASTKNKKQLHALKSEQAQASYTLAKLYHYGIRGVPQNLTMALQYYEMAAKVGHWEAAGFAGDFYLWGIGVEEQDPYKAHKYFSMGLPHGVEGCRRKLEMKLKQKQLLNQGKSVSPAPKDIHLCDSNCLNGMGVLLVLGLPLLVSQDLQAAEQYFQLAKDQRSRDATYNLAMLRLGWKVHYRPISEALMRRKDKDGSGDDEDGSDGDKKENGQTLIQDEYFPKDYIPVNHPSQSEMQQILQDLDAAASNGHIQARHRLAKMYASGVTITHNVEVVPRSCEKAVKHFKWILENASPHRSMRLRTAYKQYMDGDTASSLRNYLAASEYSGLAQVNAAFLLEQGECLGLSKVDCAKASVRLYKAAADRGYAEASLRVGDFYYYGRFREDPGVVGPFGWFEYILYPEKHVPKLVTKFVDKLQTLMRAVVGGSAEDSSPDAVASDDTCTTVDESCPATLADGESLDEEEDYVDQHSLETDLNMAARFYRMAAERSSSPRANFNLGFLYEWGLGLKQDFPLAKRHYDLAITSSGASREADLPATIALLCLSIHENLVRFWISWEEWLNSTKEKKVATPDRDSKSSYASGTEDVTGAPRAAVGKGEVPSVSGTHGFGRPVPGGVDRRLTKKDVLIFHLLSWESLLILVLTIILSVLLQMRLRTRRR